MSFFQIILFCLYITNTISYLNPYLLKNSILRQNQVLYSTSFNLRDKYSVDEFLIENTSSDIAGVYAIANNDDGVTYIGISFNISSELLILKNKMKENEKDNEKIQTIRIQTFGNSDKDAMIAYKNELIRQIGGEPEGNREEWMPNVIEEKENDNTNSRLSALAALIEEDRKDTANEYGQQIIITEYPKEGEVISPFSAPDVTLNDNGEELEFTVENVDKVLDEIRPYLVADGGNVAVDSIDDQTRDVRLILQGACGNCPSSTTTMKMGIERVLKENFSNLGDVLAVDDPNAVAEEGEQNLTPDMESVRAALEKVLPAVTGMGGAIEDVVVDADSGSVTMKYKGPTKLKQGIEIVLKENPIISEVIFEDM